MEDIILQEKHFSIQPFNRLRIGDSECFKSGGSPSLKKAVLDLQHIPVTGRTAGARIRSLRQLARNDKVGNFLVESESAGRYVPSLLKKECEFGCGTARFDFETENCSGAIDTLSGGYGFAHHYKNNDAVFVCLALDADAMSFKGAEDCIREFFRNVNEIKE